jgi:poly(beta-D-mannuronate) lyase
MQRLLNLGVTAGLAVAMSGGSMAGPALKSPFGSIEFAQERPVSVRQCKRPPKAVRDISTVSKYGEDREAHRSTIIDAEAAARYAEDSRGLTEFSRGVSNFADDAVSDDADANQDARCAMVWMNGWALQHGLLGKVNPTGESLRKWELASLAAAYLKVREAPQDPAESARVGAWLRRIATEVRSDYSRGMNRDSRSNNHLNWAAWAVMVAAIAADDRDLFAWSVDRLHYALGQIAADGTLPLELKRRQLALAYHNFALAPLIMLREGAYANGIELSPDEERRLQALVDRVIMGIGDPSFIEAKSGFPQDVTQIKATQLAWLEPYFARSGDPRAKQLLDRYRPLTSRRLGGDLTVLFQDGAPSEPRARR